jgi:hypothetical protein
MADTVGGRSAEFTGGSTGEPVARSGTAGDEMGVPQGGGRAEAAHPVFLDDVLIDRWFAELARSARPIPQSLRDLFHI